MDQATYQGWWALHLRVARGEALNADDQALYEVGRTELEQQEDLRDPSASVREAQAAVAALQAERATLSARREQLDAEIASLEGALDQRS